jgi:lipopolysaccharide transport system ATP-binding protein
MSQIVIQMEGISKVYKTGKTSTGNLSRDFAAWWGSLFKKQNDLEKNMFQNQPRRYFQALQDISVEIKQSEVLGIIGGNGAGKSTLLKILSRITKPTSGRIRIKGRIASLLEVGTGFHPDLTGRENIFLNGAILGMRRDEIRNKLDEIIAFSAIERFIDTPVKRYSSGMYVRLAFAVAAHLEPEILIIDEILAVGDVEFQKKCLGKMKEVSHNQGRTVIFVSHNMASVKSLCSRAILLQNGQLHREGSSDQIVDYYLNNQMSGKNKFHFITVPNDSASLLSLSIQNIKKQPTCNFSVAEPWQIIVDFAVNLPVSDLTISIDVLTMENIAVRTMSSHPAKFVKGNFQAVFFEDEIIYAAGTYHLVLSLSKNGHVYQYIDTEAYISFEDSRENTSVLKTKNKGLIINPMEIPIHRIS